MNRFLCLCVFIFGAISCLCVSNLLSEQLEPLVGQFKVFTGIPVGILSAKLILGTLDFFDWFE